MVYLGQVGSVRSDRVRRGFTKRGDFKVDEGCTEVVRTDKVG